MNYRIGVDGGGTTTRAVVIDESMNALGRGESDSSNYFNVGLESAVANVVAAIQGALSEAGLSREQISGYGVALAGVVSDNERDVVSRVLGPALGGARLVVDEDCAGAQAGAFGGEAGAIIIAGTGSNCFGIDERGERVRADGWGPLLGDRGSGYSIGESALRAVCRANDGVGGPTALTAPVLAAFGVDSIAGLIPVVYAPDFRRDRIAALVPVVLEAADAGDATAISLLENAGASLAATAGAVLTQLGVFRIAPTGGVISRKSPLRASFEKTLQVALPEVSVTEPMYDAAIGAALLVSA